MLFSESQQTDMYWIFRYMATYVPDLIWFHVFAICAELYCQWFHIKSLLHTHNSFLDFPVPLYLYFSVMDSYCFDVIVSISMWRRIIKGIKGIHGMHLVFPSHQLPWH